MKKIRALLLALVLPVLSACGAGAITEPEQGGYAGSGNQTGTTSGVVQPTTGYAGSGN